MGYAMALGTCYGCGALFSFNPIRVPSIRIEEARRPICASCVDRVNPLRQANGLPPIVPLPDAYDACEEGEIG